MKILDSDHWIALLRGKLDLRNHVAASDILAMTSISVGELVYGAEKSNRPVQNLLQIDTLLTTVTILDYDNQAAHRFGKIKRALERQGEKLSDADLHIAAIALTNNVPLVTHNTRHFRRIQQLTIEDWLVP